MVGARYVVQVLGQGYLHQVLVVVARQDREEHHYYTRNGEVVRHHRGHVREKLCELVDLEGRAETEGVGALAGYSAHPVDIGRYVVSALEGVFLDCRGEDTQNPKEFIVGLEVLSSDCKLVGLGEQVFEFDLPSLY